MRLRISGSFLSEFCLRLFTIFLPIHFGHWAIVKTPLYFLVASAILNVLGDLLFVAVFGWGVAGSAISTVLSEASSCLFCALYIRKRVPLLCLGKRWFVFDKSLMKKTISYGSTSAMQQVCLQIGKTIIQAVVNTQGVSVMAAFHRQ